MRLYKTPDLREHVLNAVSIETSRGIRLTKEKQSAKIDGCVALSFAVLAAVQHGRPLSLTPEPMKRIQVGLRFDARRLSGRY